MNRLKASIAAFLITAVVACGMLAVGLAVALNPKGVAASDSPVSQTVSEPAAGSSGSTADTQVLAQAQAQIAQLQNLIAQYKAREQQYQSREQQYRSQLEQANSTVQGYQQILVELQRRGVIRILRDGRIAVTGGEGAGDDGGG